MFLCGHPRRSSDGCERLFDRVVSGSDIKDVAPRSKDNPRPCEQEPPRNVTNVTSSSKAPVANA